MDISTENAEFLDIESTADYELEEALLPEDCKFVTKNTTPNIESLILDWQDKTLQIPEFQRGFVWDIKQASKFIESLLLELPIPNLFFYCDKQQNFLLLMGNND